MGSLRSSRPNSNGPRPSKSAKYRLSNMLSGSGQVSFYNKPSTKIRGSKGPLRKIYTLPKPRLTGMEISRAQQIRLRAHRLGLRGGLGEVMKKMGYTRQQVLNVLVEEYIAAAHLPAAARKLAIVKVQLLFGK